MPTLDTTNLENLANLDFATFKVLHFQGLNRASIYYNTLKTEAVNAGLLHVENYAQLAGHVVNDDNVNGVLANNFTINIASNNNIDFSASGDNRLLVQFELMQNDVATRLDNINQGGTGELSFQDTIDIHTLALDAVGLPPESFSLYTPLTILAEHDPQQAQFLFQTTIDGEGFLDILQDSILLGFGSNISGQQNLSEVLDDWGSQAGWVTTALQAAGSFVVNNSGGYDTSEIEDWLNKYQLIFNLAGGAFQNVSDWVDNVSGVLGDLPPWLDDVLGPINATPGYNGSAGTGGGGADPLVFDLDRDGLIEMTSIADGVYYDFWGDGYAEKVGWIGADDGILVWDKDADGLIEGYTEMVASAYPLTYLLDDFRQNDFNDEHGFAQLGLLDDNGDGIINDQDTIYTTLQVWQDINQDGVSDAGELFSLASLNIASIDVAGAQNAGGNFGYNRIINGNTVTHASTYTLTDGSSYEIVDAWFAQDVMDSYYTGDYTLDIRTLFLPTLRGYGNLKDLHVEMSLNTSLLDDVTNFVTTYDFAGIFSNFSNAQADTRSILLKWAGVDENALGTVPQVAEDGRLGYMPEYYFLEKLTGIDSQWLGTWFDERPFLPRPDDAQIALLDSWAGVLNVLSSRILFQSGASALFDNPPTYNPSTDTYEGTFALSQTAVSDLEIAATGHADVEGFWNSVALFIEDTMGVSNLSATEISWLDTAIANSSSSALDWAEIAATIDLQVIDGVAGDLTIDGTRYNDELNKQYIASSYSEDKMVNGYGGNDILYGGGGDDVLDGGLGNDVLYGDAGSDTYIYNYGHDVILNRETSENEIDIIKFDAGISVSDVSLEIARTNGILTENYILNVEGRGTLTLQAINLFGTSMGRIYDELHFDDGTIINFEDMDYVLHGTNKDDNLGRVNLKGEMTYYGYGGDDTIYLGTSHADVVQPLTYVDGGDGDDVINGSQGDTIYMMSQGKDLIYDRTLGNDVLIIPPEFENAKIEFLRTSETIGTYNYAYDNAVINVEGLGSVFVMDYFSYYENGNVFMDVQLPDGSILNLEDQNFITIGTDADDFIQHRTSSTRIDDTYQFTSGQDVITDSSGVDNLLMLENHQLSDLDLYVTQYNGGYGTSFVGLHIADAIGNKTVIANQFKDVNYSNSALGAMETLTFSDGTIVNLDSLEYELRGTTGNDNIHGLEFGDLTTDDVIWGYEGDDQLSGKSGDDILIGGQGNDNVVGDAGTDIARYVGNYQDFTLSLTGAYWKLVDNVGLEGTDYLNTVEFIEFADGVFDTATQIFTSNQNLIEGTSAKETLSDTAGDDLIYGYGGNDIIKAYGGGDDEIYGGAGNDKLYVRAGENKIYGEEGNDTILAFYGNDFIDGGSGTDKLKYTNTSGGVEIDVENGTVDEGRDGQINDTFTNIEYIYGSKYNDVITGHNGARLYGLNGNDVLYGSDGVDRLYGGNNNDTINGGAGADLLYGQKGADTFVFDQATGFIGLDKIVDFKLSENDAIDISDLLTNYDPLTDALGDFVKLTESKGHTFLKVDADGGGNSFVNVARINKVIDLPDVDVLEADGNLIV